MVYNNSYPYLTPVQVVDSNLEIDDQVVDADSQQPSALTKLL